MKGTPTPNTTLVTFFRPFCKLFFKFLGPISPERLDINAPNLNRRLHSISSTPSPNFILLAHSIRPHNAKNVLKYAGLYLHSLIVPISALRDIQTRDTPIGAVKRSLCVEICFQL